MTEDIFISVIICTYNRSELLHDLLKDLFNQTMAKQVFEVIVVDNNSRDTTRDTVCSLMAKFTNLKYECEENQGLSYARNRGWREAKGEYIVYIDDDCRVPFDFLFKSREILSQKKPGVAGGPYFAYYKSSKPKWFKDEYGSQSLGKMPKKLSHEEYLSGGNLFIKKDLLIKTQGFDVLFGMAGNKLGYGEETLWLKELRITFPEEIVYYDPSLFVYHLVAERKMKLLWSIQQRFIRGRYSYRTFSGVFSNVGFATELFRIVWRLFAVAYYSTFGCLFRDRRKFKYFQNYIFEVVLWQIERLGYVMEEAFNRLGNKNTQYN